jgi:K+-sensing histidine kinase KdpD
MEHILVGMHDTYGAWEALARGCALAKRIDARLHVLQVRTPLGRQAVHSETGRETLVRKRLELLIEKAKSEGVQIDYFITEGDYEEEVIRFVNHHRITLLVYELARGDIKLVEKGTSPLQAIRHRVACKVEIVAPRRDIPKKQERTT